MRHVGILMLVVFFSFASTASPHAQTFTVLHTFTGSPADGASPVTAALLDVNGTLYGTTLAGGLHGFGSVYKLERNGKETVLYSFTGGADGAYPSANLVADREGNLYSTAGEGGLPCAVATNLYGGNGCGVVFKLDTSGKETVLYSFSGGTDGGMPSYVAMNSEGHLYGVASFGGNLNCSGGFWTGYGCGVVFKLHKSGKETVLYSFSGEADGAVPFPFLTTDWAGNIYGVAQYAGTPPNPASCFGNGCGVVYKLDARGKETTLYTFTGGTDGFLPNGPLLLDERGNLYGNTEYGGDPTCSCGVVYKLDVWGKLTVLHTFMGGTDGAVPWVGMSWGLQGDIYGTTIYGGDPACNNGSGCGVVFKLDGERETVLYRFSGSADGAFPFSGLITDSHGNLYGNTGGGGDLSCSSLVSTVGCGTVFKLGHDKP